MAKRATLATAAQQARHQEEAPAERQATKYPARVSLYVDRRVQRVVKHLAADKGCKPHDIYLRGLDLVLAENGLPSIKSTVAS